MRSTKQYGTKAARALSLWVKLSRAHNVFAHEINRNIREFGLTAPQFGVLETLGHLGPMKLSTLCEKQLVTGGNMTLVVDNLEKEGFVERARNKEDRRTILVKLTEKGENLFSEIFPKHAGFITEISSVLSPAEQEELQKLLKKLGTAIQESKK